MDVWVWGVWLAMLAAVACLLVGRGREGYDPQPPSSRPPSQRRGFFVKHLIPNVQTFLIQKGQGAGRAHATPDLHYDLSKVVKGWRGLVASYWIKFHEDFEWSCRGKIGGFFVGPGDSSGKEHSTDGASHRLMWSSSGTGYGYVYVPLNTEPSQPSPLYKPADKVSETDPGSNWLLSQNLKMPEGTWTYVEMGVWLNSFDARGKPNKDGILYLRIGNKAYNLDNVIMRSKPEHGYEAFKFAVFHGGGCQATRRSAVSIAHAALFSFK